MATEKKFDQTTLQFNRASIMTLLLLGFLLNQPWLVALVGAVMIVGTIWPQAGLFKQIYLQVLKPRGWLKPNLIDDDPAPHQFAQGLGGIVLALGSLGFALGTPLVGWAAAWVVIVLTALTFFPGICIGCFIYYQLARLGIRVPMPL